MEEAGHFVEIFSSKRLISAGPKQHAGMVFIPLKHAVRAVQNQIEVLRSVPGNCLLECDIAPEYHVPQTMRFQIRLVDDIETVEITEPVKGGLVRIVTRTDRIDVVALHRQKIGANRLRINRPSPVRAELMAVHSVKHDAFSIDMHHVINHLKTAESEELKDGLTANIFIVEGTYSHLIQEGILCAPEPRLTGIQKNFRPIYGFFIFSRMSKALSGAIDEILCHQFFCLRLHRSGF